MKNTTTTSAGLAFSSLAIAAWLALSAPAAQALGLGRLSVRSSLGEPLRAEIDISSIAPDEADSLRAALASPEAFRAAGVEMNPALQGVQVTLVRGADGRPVLRMAGDRAVSEPFLDLILDLSWASGRLQRSYTLLIDPPIKPAPAPAPQTAPVMSNAPAAAPVTRPVRPQPAPSAEPVAPTAASAPAARPPAPASPPAPAAPTAPAQGYRVKSGDTLSSIANANARPGVSLDQMLVALYRGNPDAFVGNNMNRLKAGVVLDVAEAQARAGDIPAAEARRVFQAQSADFAAFRQRLAGAAPVVKSAEPPRQAQGKVEAAVRDRKTDSQPTPDQLKLSKGGLKAASAPEAKISKDTERKAAEARMSELTRNVEELKRLSAGASAPGKPASAAVVPPVAVTKPAAVPPPPPPPSAPASTPAPAPAVVASVPASAALPASAPVVAASAAAPASAAASRPQRPPAPAPAAEPGLLDSLSENPFVLPLGVGLVALLAGWGVMRLRRRGQEGAGETSFIESKLQPDSFFGASGGQRVDTRDGASSAAASSSLSYSLSQLDAIGDVDPVAEADVYLAYGRDLQAEEILKEALRTDPARAAIRTKLLEVYAKRADTEAFMQQARQLHDMTGGQGEDWSRAAELGRQLDPGEPMFAATEDALPATASLVDDLSPAATLAPEPLPEPDPVPAAAAAPAGPSSTYDIDIDLDSPSQLSGLENTRPMTGSEPTMDLGEASVHGMLDDDPVTTRRGRLDELDLGEQTSPSAFDALAPELPPVAAPAPVATAAPRDAQPSAPVDFDFGDLSLDLPGEPAAPPPPATGDDLDAGAGDPLQRKIELADEFRRIGDVEGARDLLQEVIEKSSGALKARAQSLLDEL